MISLEEMRARHSEEGLDQKTGREGRREGGREGKREEGREGGGGEGDER